MAAHSEDIAFVPVLVTTVNATYFVAKDAGNENSPPPDTPAPPPTRPLANRVPFQDLGDPRRKVRRIARTRVGLSLQGSLDDCVAIPPSTARPPLADRPQSQGKTQRGVQVSLEYVF